MLDGSFPIGGSRQIRRPVINSCIPASWSPPDRRAGAVPRVLRGWRLDPWPDVLVQVEEIGGVVGCLGGHQTLIGGGTVGGPDPVLSLVAQEVDVHAARGVWLHRCGESPHPLVVRSGFVWVAPCGDGVQSERRAPVTIRRLVG